MNHPLDSFDNDKIRCEKCGEFFERKEKSPYKMCNKCFIKLFTKDQKYEFKKPYPNINKEFKENNFINNIKKWFKK